MMGTFWGKKLGNSINFSIEHLEDLMPYQGVSYPIKEECSALKIHIYHMKDLFNIIKYPYLKIVLQWVKMIMLDEKRGIVQTVTS